MRLGRVRAVEDDLDRGEIERANALFSAIRLVDGDLAVHCGAVSVYARDVAIELGLSEDDQSVVFSSASVHDLGKLALPRELVWKPGELSLEERRAFEKHVTLAEETLTQADCRRLAPIVRHQAERFDGFGYPDGLAGEAIPLASRILAVADVYNDLTMTTAVRDGLPSHQALQQIVQGVATRFDPGIVAVFRELITRLDQAAGQPVAGTA